ncbi:MAG: energy-coupled thiamine transporter ThiT [Acutalibacteraceae bacterium]
MNNTSLNKNTVRLVVSGVLIGMAVALSFVKVFELPYGGSITLFSMVPICILGIIYGPVWGLLCGLVDGILQAVLGAATTGAFAGLTGSSVVAMAALDYLFAFAVIGLAGLLRKPLKNHIILAGGIGAFIACVLRLLCHFLSGWILWGSYAEWFFTDVMNNSFGSNILNSFSGQGLAAIYSIVYNGSYMIPETIITVVGVVIVLAVAPVRRMAQENNK